MASKKPLPKMGETATVLAEFVETGKLHAEKGAPAAVTPSRRTDARRDARHDGVTRVMTAELAVVRPDEHDEALLDDMRAIREARRKRSEPEPRTVKTTIRLPESVARELKIIAIQEGVTMTAIAEDVLRAWVATRYDGGGQ